MKKYILDTLFSDLYHFLLSAIFVIYTLFLSEWINDTSFQESVVFRMALFRSQWGWGVKMAVFLHSIIYNIIIIVSICSYLAASQRKTTEKNVYFPLQFLKIP